MSKPSQLFLLADHIKLSLLERQRAVSLNLEPNSQDGEISRSLDSLREGVEAAEADYARLEESDDPTASDMKDQTTNLRSQYNDLVSQFYGNENVSKTPNDPYLAEDFAHASSNAPLKHPTPQHPPSKSVRFTDMPSSSAADDEDPNRSSLLHPYRDSPSPTGQDQSGFSNQQIHAHHAQILRDQDEQLDHLGESIGRQHQLSIQIGDELEGQVALLDDVDEHTERHTSRLEGAKKRLNKFRRNASESWSLMTIIGLVIVLMILIVILK
ncbi:hypothetical protein FQN54_003265 [Arachnomyces sp. PD_36]|nr:hypothetical protein FQN54_003265 [Arachnomyces sp. PD_36]